MKSLISKTGLILVLILLHCNLFAQNSKFGAEKKVTMWFPIAGWSDDINFRVHVVEEGSEYLGLKFEWKNLSTSQYAYVAYGTWYEVSDKPKYQLNYIKMRPGSGTYFDKTIMYIPKKAGNNSFSGDYNTLYYGDLGHYFLQMVCARVINPDKWTSMACNRTKESEFTLMK